MNSLLRAYGLEFGILKNGKFSAGGLCNFLFQFAYLFVSFSFLFRPQFGPLADTWNPLVACVLGIACMLTLHGTMRTLLSLYYNKLGGDREGEPIASNRDFWTGALKSLSFALLLMALPGFLFLALSHYLPGYFAIKSASEAFACGIMVMAGDTVLGTLTGVRLLLPDRRKKPEEKKSDSGK